MPFKTVKIDSTLKPKSLNGLKVYPLNEIRLIILWHKCVARIFYLTYPMEKLTKCYGVLQCTDEIKDVILTKSTLIFLSRVGVIYTAELQDGMIRKTGQAIEHKEFQFVKNVITINTTSEGFLLITEKGELMAFKISYLENGKSKISQKMMMNVPGNIGQVHKGSCVITCHPHDIHMNLASLLFKDIALLKCDIVFVGLDNGNVYWLPLLNNAVDSKFNLIHNATSAIMSIVFASGGKAQQSNHIVILSSHGSVAVIHRMENQLKCKVHHLPGSVHCATSVSPNTIFHSDGLNLWCSEITSESDIDVTFNTQLLHIKGVVALAYESRTHEVVVGCRHCIIYKIDPSSPNVPKDDETLAIRSETSDETGSLLREWHNAIQELNFLKEIISSENKVINEISTATRGIILRDMIKLRIEVSDDFPYALKNTLALKVLNESPQEFSNEFWLFHIQVNSDKWNTCVTEKLENSFKPNSTMIFIVPLNPVDLIFPVTVDCSLVLSVPMGDCSNNDAHQFHEIPMQRVFLDVIDFITPVLEDLSVSHQSLSKGNDTWEQFLARFQHVSSVQGSAIRKGESQLLHCYSFKLPETESWSDFKDRMIKKSEQRLHLSIKNANKLKFRVRDCIITFTCSSDNQTVNIVTLNKYLLSEIQAFIVHKILSTTNESNNITSVCVDEVNYLKFRNINLALELDTEKGSSWKNLSTLKRELRNLFDLHLPDLKNS